VALKVAMTVSLQRDSSRLDIVMTVENAARDHRLRVHFPMPFAVTDSYADTPYHVTRRPAIKPRRDPGAPELELPTYPMRAFVDVSGERGGVALISHGLHEYEVIPGGSPELALTLLRAVGWLSRDDLRTRTGHAGPPMETPGAQVLGSHHFRYSLLFHQGGWEEAAIWRAADTALLPLMLGVGTPISGPAPSIQLEPNCLQMIACIPRADGYDLRLLNASDRPQEAIVRVTPAPLAVQQLNLGGVVQANLESDNGVLRLPLRRWEIATLRIRHAGRPS
jgi:alpha-mannosidase